MMEVEHCGSDTVDFEQAYAAFKSTSLIMIEGGFCQFRRLRNGSITIYVIFSSIPGNGLKMLKMLDSLNPTCIRAVCPQDLESNNFYKKYFELKLVKQSKTGRPLNVWEKYHAIP